MAAFLFVGCIPDVVTPPVDEEEEEEEEEVVVAATVAPIITSITDNAAVPAAVISLTSTATRYMNAAEVALGIIVNGTAPTYSEVKVYVDDVCAGTADVGVSGTFAVVVAEADLGADGDKVIYATAKEAAIDVSAHSTEYAFVLDQVKPTATTLAATAAAANAVDSTIVSGSGAIDSAYIAGSGTLVAGAYTINCLGDSSELSNVVVTTPAGVSTTYSIGIANYLDLGIIPGVELDFLSTFAAGDACTVTVTTTIASRATVLFDEEVTYATASGANYTWTSWDLSLNASNAVNVATFINYVSLKSYFSPITCALALARYDTLNCVVNGMTDLAGNTQTVANVLSCTVGAASATSLAP
jgi:hypothetical protein